MKKEKFCRKCGDKLKKAHSIRFNEKTGKEEFYMLCPKLCNCLHENIERNPWCGFGSNLEFTCLTCGIEYYDGQGYRWKRQRN